MRNPAVINEVTKISLCPQPAAASPGQPESDIKAVYFCERKKIKFDLQCRLLSATECAENRVELLHVCPFFASVPLDSP